MPSAMALLKFVAPAFCLVVANSSMSSVDKGFLGQQSTLQLAAMGPAAAAFDSSSYLLTFLNTATLSLLGMAARDGDAERGHRIRSHAMILATGSAFVLAVFLAVAAVPLTRTLGATPAMLPHSVMYLRLRALGAPIERGTSVATSFCLAMKDGTTPLFVTLIGLVANIIGDSLLCRRYGLEGVALASVVASAIGYGYLIYSLVQRRLWPWPLSWPKGVRDILPFLKFAGPVLFAVFLKTMTLANMTAAASSLGTSAAAAHQICITLFFLSAVALGNPFSWAAQAFLPPLLAAGGGARRIGGRPGAGAATRAWPRSLVALTRLLATAFAASLVASALVVVFCRSLGWVATRDARVLHELVRSSAALVPFLALYPVLLTLEGALYSAQQQGSVLVLSFVFWWTSTAALRMLREFGMLNLSTVWLSTGVACGAATLITAGLAARAMYPKAKAAIKEVL